MPEYKGKRYPYTAEGIAQLERDKRRDAQRPGSGVTFPDGTYSPDADPGSVTVSQASNRDDMPQWGDKILSPEQFDRLQKIIQLHLFLPNGLTKKFGQSLMKMI